MRRSSAVSIGLLMMMACGSSSSKPSVQDVQAARTCQDFSVFVQGKGQGDPATLLNDAGQLLAGTAEAEASSTPPPKWARLGSDIITAAGDIRSGDDAAAITRDGNAVVAECAKIPGDAKKAGGYVR